MFTCVKASNALHFKMPTILHSIYLRVITIRNTATVPNSDLAHHKYKISSLLSS